MGKDHTYKLRPLTYSDLLIIKDWRNKQIEILRQKKPLTDQDQKNYWERIQSSGREKLYAIEGPDGKLCGYTGFVNLDMEYQKAEISFLVNPEIQEGMAKYAEIFSQSLVQLKEIAFAELGLNRVYTETYEFRKEHMEVIEKAGFKTEGRLREHVVKNGKHYDSIMHGFIKKDLTDG